MFLSSFDKTASIVTLDQGLQIVSRLKLEGHTHFVNDIVPLPASHQCITCSDDTTSKVWDCQTGACLQTLTQHTYHVKALTLHPHSAMFASVSWDQSVIVWSSETFAVLHRIPTANWIDSVVFAESNVVYAGVFDHGVISCNALAGEAGPAVIPGRKATTGLAIRNSA